MSVECNYKGITNGENCANIEIWKLGASEKVGSEMFYRKGYKFYFKLNRQFVSWDGN